MQTGTESGEGKRKRVKGRKDENKQELATQPKLVGEKIDELVTLYKTHAESGVALSDGIKAVAEKSGYNAAAVRKLVVARAGEKFAEQKRLVEQQMELFDEVGE